MVKTPVFSVYVRVEGCAYMCMCMYNPHIWRPEVNAGYLPQSPPDFFETGLRFNLELTDLSRLSVP